MAQPNSTMIERYLEHIPEKVLNFFIQVVLTALIAMSVKIAIQMKHEKVSLLNVILSFVVGMGVAILSGNLVLDKFSPSSAPIIIAAIALVGEKVGFWLIYKFNVDAVMQGFIDFLIKKYKK